MKRGRGRPRKVANNNLPIGSLSSLDKIGSHLTGVSLDTIGPCGLELNDQVNSGLNIIEYNGNVTEHSQVGFEVEMSNENLIENKGIFERLKRFESNAIKGIYKMLINEHGITNEITIESLTKCLIICMKDVFQIYHIAAKILHLARF